MITFFAKPSFSGFLICVINESVICFGQVANLLEFVPRHMTAFLVYMLLDFQTSCNFERVLAYPFDYVL